MVVKFPSFSIRIMTGIDGRDGGQSDSSALHSCTGAAHCQPGRSGNLAVGHRQHAGRQRLERRRPLPVRIHDTCIHVCIVIIIMC